MLRMDARCGSTNCAANAIMGDNICKWGYSMIARLSFTTLSALGLMTSACSAEVASNSAPQAATKSVNPQDQTGEHQAAPLSAAPFTLKEAGSFNEPWAMTFLPGGKQALITERGGALKLWEADKASVQISGIPAVKYAGQGGLGDVVLAPDFATSQIIYLSWAEAGEGDVAGAAVGKAKLVLGDAPRLENIEVIWRQMPKVTGGGHYSHRLAFSPDGQYLFIGSGDRQKMEPAQDMASSLGKIIRIKPDGSIPADNPFAAKGGVTAGVWTLGHRNILGLTFDGEGRLWNQEMGPKHGDEINLVVAKSNYGWPVVSNGDHYDGRVIPNHDTRSDLAAPALWWNPAVSPGGLAYYGGNLYPNWNKSLLMGALSGQALVRASLHGDRLSKADRWDLGMRIREVEVNEDGSVWLLNDGKDGKLWKLEPKG